MTDVVDPADDSWVSALLAESAEPAIPESVAVRMRHVIDQERAARIAAAESAAISDLADQRRVRRPMWPWAIAGGFAAAAAVAAVFVAQPFTSSPPANPTQAAGGQTTAVPISSGSQYTASNVTELVPAHLVATTAAEAAPMAARQATFLATADGVNDCLAGLGTNSAHLRMIDLASYENLPVAVLAFLDNDADRTADVVVVGVRCNRTDPQIRLRGVARITPAPQTAGE